MKTLGEKIYEAAHNMHQASALEIKFAELFGTKATLVQGEQRFETRRVGNTTYLMDRRLTDRRTTKH
jgi:hypothetical protein